MKLTTKSTQCHKLKSAGFALSVTKTTTAIAEIRAKNGKMTQREFGDSVGVSTQTVNSWEKDIYRISAKNLIKICEIYHVSSSDLLGT